jgi:hypothetical protein
MRILIVSLCLFSAAVLNAGTIEYTPVLQPQLAGNTLTLDLLAFYTGSDPQVPMGGFSAVLNYDPALLTLSMTQFDVFLGDAAFGEVLTSAIPGPGSIALSAVSDLFANVLGPSQPPVFPLATLTFTSTISDSQVDPGSTLEESFSLGLSSFTWSQAKVCPEPSTWILLSVGFIGLELARRRRLFR